MGFLGCEGTSLAHIQFSIQLYPPGPFHQGCDLSLCLPACTNSRGCHDSEARTCTWHCCMRFTTWACLGPWKWDCTNKCVFHSLEFAQHQLHPVCTQSVLFADVILLKVGECYLRKLRVFTYLVFMHKPKFTCVGAWEVQAAALSHEYLQTKANLQLQVRWLVSSSVPGTAALAALLSSMLSFGDYIWGVLESQLVLY